MGASADTAVVVLAVIDATLVALFFLYRVLPWSTPGPWRPIWALATLTSLGFIAGEVAAARLGGEALAIEHQGPIFVAILSASSCFILAYLRGPGSVAQERQAQRQQIESHNEYLSILAHELRNPLVAISAAARVVARRDSDAQSASLGAGIADEARSAIALLDGLTDLTSIESRRLVSALQPLDLASVVRDTVQSAQGDRSVRLVGADTPLPVLGDAQRLGQVVRNLLANAAKYSPADRPIEVAVGRDAGRRCAVVSIRDYGPGVPPAERDRLFRKFSRLSTSGETRGSGLGLYICREIVRDHGGEISADWPAGGGSLFAFSLPLQGQ